MIELLAAAGLLLGPGAGADAPALPSASLVSDAPAAAVQQATDAPPRRDRGDRAVPDSLEGAIRGRVLGQESGEPLSFVVIEVGEGDGYRATRTDEDGRYELEGVAPGRRQLRARALDRQPLELTIEIPARETVQLDLSLGLRPVGLPLLRVMGLTSWTEVNLRRDRELTPGSPAAAELRALEASPGVAELGLAEKVQPEPGSTPTDPNSTLYVRGATSDLKMVLLDGAPVYAPFHLGGLMDALQPGIIDSSRVFVGGAPARYNGGLSYIMDLGTRPGRVDGASARGAVDLLGARTQVEGPVGPGSYYVGVRGLHGLGSRGLTDQPLPYGYEDLLSRVDMPLTDADRIAVTGFLNRESVDLDPEAGFDGSVHWGNRAGSVRYQHSIEEGEVRLMAAGGRFGTRLPASDDPGRAAEGRNTRTRLAVDATRRLEGLQLQLGASYDHYEVGYRRSSSRSEDATLPWRRSTGDMLGAYGDVILPAADGLSLRAGLRSDLFMPEMEGRLSPRLTAALELGATSVLSVTAGRYHQYVRSPETVLGSGIGTFGPPAADADSAPREQVDTQLRVASASHVVVGLDHAPKEGLRVGVEGFLKRFQDVPRADAMRSSGLDLWVDYRADDWSAWGGYGLAFVWTRSDEAQYRDDFAGRHLFSGGLSAPLPSDVRLDVQVATSAGLPFTPIPTPVEPTASSRRASASTGAVRPAASGSDQLLAGTPDGSYLRLDLKLSRSWPLHLLDSDVELTPYVQILNALDRRDALFYQLDSADDLKPRALSAVPFLPVAGVEWSL